MKVFYKFFFVIRVAKLLKITVRLFLMANFFAYSMKDFIKRNILIFSRNQTIAL